jgi:hypothetical protein
MYKNSRIRFVGTTASNASNATLSGRTHLNTLPAVPRLAITRSAENPNGNKYAEIYIGSANEDDTFTCIIYQAKEVFGIRNTPVGFVVSPLCSVACVCASDTSGILGSAAGTGVPDLYVVNEYTVTVSTTATTPKGIGATVGTAYGGGIVAYSPTNGQDGRIIISDCGNSDFLLFDVYGGSAVNRYVFAEAGV